MDVAPREAFLAFAHLHPHLRGENDFLSLPGASEPFTKDGFAFATIMAGDEDGIYISCINEIEPVVDESV